MFLGSLLLVGCNNSSYKELVRYTCTTPTSIGESTKEVILVNEESGYFTIQQLNGLELKLDKHYCTLHHTGVYIENPHGFFHDWFE